jgi:hypothetical protein
MSDAPDPPRPLSPARKAWRFLRLLARPVLARKLGTLATTGYLAETGWVRSVLGGAVVDARGAPLPWATLPFADFIAPRLRADWQVFEYGAGASTRFYAARVRAVLAVEHDEAFAAQLRLRLPANARLLVRALASAAYPDAIAECAPPPELVSVDGRDRVHCVAAALGRLAPGGVLVLDDSERVDYAPARAALTAAGFRAIEFWGLAPGRVERKCTSVYYRSENVLGL